MRRHALLSMLILLALPWASVAQPGPAALAPPALTAEQQVAVGEASAAARELSMIRIIQTLISGESAPGIIAVMEAIQVEKSAIDEASGALSKKALSAVQDSLTAWMTLGAVNPSDRDVALRAIMTRARKVAPHRQKIDALVAGVEAAVMKSNKRDLLTSEDEALRQGAGGALDGSIQGPDRIVKAIQDVARLDGPAFDAGLDANARVIAASVLGAGSPMLEPMAGRVKNLLLQLHPLTPQQWQQQSATVRESIVTTLGLQPQAPGGAGQPAGDTVARSALRAFLCDARALELLKSIAAPAGDKPAPGGDEVDADPLAP